MRKIITVLVLASLAGCTATMTETRQKGPAKVFSSSVPARELAECIRDTWQSQSMFGNNTDSYMDTRGSSYVVRTVGAEQFADVSPAKDGARVSYYQASNTWISRKRLSGLQGCL